MFRRTTYMLAGQAGRTIVRDPRKKKAVSSPSLTNAVSGSGQSHLTPSQQHEQQQPAVPPLHQQPPLPFEPSQQNHQSFGSTMAHYALAGVGVSLGVILVRVVLGF